MVTPQSTNTKQLTVSGSSKVQRRRAKILKAAIKAFAEKGFDAASTRVIATNADIEQGHLTYHFRNKELLWRAAADQIFGEMADDTALVSQRVSSERLTRSGFSFEHAQLEQALRQELSSTL